MALQVVLYNPDEKGLYGGQAPEWENSSSNFDALFLLKSLSNTEAPRSPANTIIRIVDFWFTWPHPWFPYNNLQVNHLFI
jgi:hypothetical protein